MRWADLDLLNHVTNVAYLGYAAEGTGALIDAGELPADAWARRIDITYRAPMMLSRLEVIVDSVIESGDGATVVRQEISQQPESGRLLHAAVTTEYAAPTPLTPRAVPEPPSTRRPSPLRVRRTDLGAGGVVTIPQLFEIVQESRIAMFGRMSRTSRPGAFVVARVDVQRSRDLRWSAAPLTAYTAVSSVGTKSVVLMTDLLDGDEVVVTADTVLVAFDAATQTSRELTETERETFAAMA